MPEDHFSISRLWAAPLQTPLVDALAAHLLEQFAHQPEQLARAWVLVPTQRAVTSLRETLLRLSAGRPMLLPSIQPLGELDIEILMPEILVMEDGGNVNSDILPALSSRQRLFELTQLVKAYAARTQMPLSVEQAVGLAQALGDLMDDLDREEVRCENLSTLVEGDLAAHWQKTLAFLDIITHIWPERLKELGRMDEGARRIRMMRKLADHWTMSPPDFPVIAAGSTGSIPATAHLLKVIASLPQGQVILSAMDGAAQDATMSDAIRRSVSHPFYGLSQLLEKLSCDINQIAVMPTLPVNAALQGRMALLNHVMIPAELSHGWREMEFPEESLDGLSLVECEDEDEESQVIALILRESLENPNSKAMLVTHDRALARRVAVLLRRYEIAVEDGGGLPLLHTPTAAFMLLVIRAADSQAASDFLALLKHPLCRLGVGAAQKFHSICEIELHFFRGIDSGETLSQRAERAHTLETVSQGAAECLRSFAEAMQPVQELYQQAQIDFRAALDMVLKAMEQLATSDDMVGAERLWRGQSGQLLSRELTHIYDHASCLGHIEPQALGALMTQLLIREIYQPSEATHPRVTILSPSHARMQHADVVILGGLNEQCWPPAPTHDPWMSRAMRENLGLPPYERQIGQAAHDFLSLCAAPKVILTRAAKVAGAPHMASRWVLRLQTVLKTFPDDVQQSFMAQALQWKAWVAEFRHVAPLAPLRRPQPSPPVAARPRRYSVSQVERLMRDPYVFYAQSILRLKPLEPIDKQPGMAEFGNAVHQALEHFATRFPSQLTLNAPQELSNMVEEAFADLLGQVKAPTFWRRRLERIVAEVIAIEQVRRPALASVASEVPLERQMQGRDAPFILTARVDRIDHYPDGRADIIDFKTGVTPKNTDVTDGYSPQLTLEGWLLQETKKVAALIYWKVPADKEKGSLLPAGGKDVDTLTLIAQAHEGLMRLLHYYDHAEVPYMSLADNDEAPKYNDYKHLERLEEWR
ncbi:MAG: double-strand break repair protein AddB [Rickettsiales bacterium]|nr:double-strand break repair protein AddB [Rickettsiales bacterium]